MLSLAKTVRIGVCQAIAGPDAGVTLRDQSGRWQPTPDYAPLGRVILLAIAAAAIIGAVLSVGMR